MRIVITMRHRLLHLIRQRAVEVLAGDDGLQGSERHVSCIDGGHCLLICPAISMWVAVWD